MTLHDRATDADNGLTGKRSCIQKKNKTMDLTILNPLFTIFSINKFRFKAFKKKNLIGH